MKALALDRSGEEGGGGGGVAGSPGAGCRGTQGAELRSLVLPTNLGGRIRSWWHGVYSPSSWGERGEPREEPVIVLGLKK
jgi:hypothetical protein